MGRLFMIDDRTFAIALTRLDALRKNLPHNVKEQQVIEYHAILDELRRHQAKTCRVSKSL